MQREPPGSSGSGTAKKLSLHTQRDGDDAPALRVVAWSWQRAQAELLLAPARALQVPFLHATASPSLACAGCKAAAVSTGVCSPSAMRAQMSEERMRGQQAHTQRPGGVALHCPGLERLVALVEVP